MSPSMAPWLAGSAPTAALELLAKVTVIFGLAGAGAAVLRRRSAAHRHLVWTLAAIAALALPLAVRVVPAVPVPVLPQWMPSAGALPPPVSSSATRGTASSSAAPGIAVSYAGYDAARAARPVIGSPAAAGPAPFSGPLAPPAARLLGALWLLGALAVAGRCLIGHVGLARLARRGTALSGSAWQELLADVAARAGVAAPVRLLLAPDVGSPLTWGARRPVILLPAGADSWPRARRRVVLAHELAHVARGDYVTQLAASAVCALYWFHPLAWLAARRLRNESERACDDLVLARGTPGADYASHLLDVARGARALGFRGAVAIGMARPSQLEGRLLAVLDDARSRRAPSAFTRTVTLAALALVLVPLAALHPAVAADRAPAPVRTPAPAGAPVAAKAPASAKTPAPAGTPAPAEAPVAAETPGADEASSKPDFERSVDAKPGEMLRLHLESGGDVNLRSWDEPRVQVRAFLAGKDAADTRVTLERVEGGVALAAKQTAHGRSWSTSHRFEIRVPRRCDVELESTGGDVVITDVEGKLTGGTGGGDVKIRGARGEAAIATGGGDIHVVDSVLRGTVTTGGGEVRFSHVSGGLRGSSGSGPVITQDEGEDEEADSVEGDAEVEDSATPVARAEGEHGEVRIAQGGGDIDLDHTPAGADVSTGGGDIHIGRSGGDVIATTGGGDIDLGPVSGSVTATTGAGDVQVWVAGAKGASIQVASGTGQVVLELPPDLSARFDLETAYTKDFRGPTKIDSAWDLKREATDAWDSSHGTPRKYVRAKGEVGGGGAVIKVRTVNGDITVRKRAK
ncbi:MAG: M56 family metallopeptidase [bacterium]